MKLILLLLFLLGAEAVCDTGANYELTSSLTSVSYVVATGASVSNVFQPKTTSLGLSIAMWVNIHPHQLPNATDAVLFSVQSSESEVTLKWEVAEMRLSLRVRVGSSADSFSSDNQLISMSSLRYRLVALTLDFKTGAVSLFVDGILTGSGTTSLLIGTSPLSFPPTAATNLTLFGLSQLTPTGRLISASVVGSFLELQVKNEGELLSLSNMRYLTSYRVALSADGEKCCGSSDDGCETLESLQVFRFNRTGLFSFPGSTVHGQSPFTRTVARSAFLIAPRLVIANATLQNVSWTLQQLQNSACGSSQSALIFSSDSTTASTTAATLQGAFDVRIRLSLASAVTLAQLNNGISLTWNELAAGNLTLIPVNTSVAELIGVVSQGFDALLSTASLKLSSNTGDFCITSVDLLQRPSAIVSPTQTWLIPGSSSHVLVPSGFQTGSSVTLISALAVGVTCESVLTTSNVNTFLIQENTTNGARWFALPPSFLPGSYSICVTLNATRFSSVSSYNASRCVPFDTTFACTLVVDLLPEGATLTSNWLPSVLALSPIPFGLPYVDYFALATGGESQIQPRVGDSLSTSQWTWSTNTAPFVASSSRTVDTVYYFAFALAVVNAGPVSLTLQFCNAVTLWVDGVSQFSANLGNGNSSDVSSKRVTSVPTFGLSAGWHQVIVKVWVSTLVTTGLFNVRVGGEGIAVALTLPTSANRSPANTPFAPMCSLSSIEAGAPQCYSLTNATLPLLHDECAAVGCCFQQFSETSWSCTKPFALQNASSPQALVRLDGKCGPLFPSLNSDAAQCALTAPFWATASSSCCSLSTNSCGFGYFYCECPSCVDYGAGAAAAASRAGSLSKYIEWGANARCLNGIAVPIGPGYFATCASACDATAACTAFSMSSIQRNGGDCILYVSPCDETVDDGKVAMLYRRVNGPGCSYVGLGQGVRCQAPSSSLFPVGSVALSSCLEMCWNSFSCFGVSFSPSASSTCSFLLTPSCTLVVGLTPNDTVQLRSCPGDNASVPVPLNVTTNTTVSAFMACVDSPAGLLAPPLNSFTPGSYTTLQYATNNYWLSTTSMTVASCQQHCQNQGAWYFTLSNGSLCTCGVSYYSDTERTGPSSQCQSTPCSGNLSASCGGLDSAALYRLSYPTSVVCPIGFLLLNNLCVLLRQQPLNFSAARAFCASLDDSASLVSIHSVQEAQLLLGLADAGLANAVWIGATVGPNGAMSWVDASPVDFSDWMRSWTTTSNETTCVSMMANRGEPTPVNGTWSSTAVSCETALPFLCQMTATLTPQVSLSTTLYGTTSDASQACAPLNSAGGRLFASSMIAWYNMNYGLQFRSTVIPDATPNVNAMQAVFNRTKVSTPLTFVADSAVGATSLSLTRNESLMAQSVWSTGEVMSLALWLKPTVGSFCGIATTANDIGVTVARQRLRDNTAVNWELQLFPFNRSICWSVRSWSVCSAVFTGTFSSCGGQEEASAWSSWSHVLAVYDGTSLILYVNGSAVGSRTIGDGALITSTSALAKVTIGSSGDPLPYEGLVDDVRFYAAALNQAMAQYLMDCTPVFSSHTDSPWLYVYATSNSSRDSVGVGLVGETFETGQRVVVTQTMGGCGTGNIVSGPTYALSSEQANAATFSISRNDVAQSASSPASFFFLCLVHEKDTSIVVGDTSLRLAPVLVASLSVGSTTILPAASGGSGGGLLDWRAYSFPFNVVVTGMNVAASQVIGLAFDSGCTTLSAVRFPLAAIDDHSTVGFQVGSSEQPYIMLQNRTTFFLCWMANSEGRGLPHPIGISVQGLPVPSGAPLVPTQSPAPPISNAVGTPPYVWGIVGAGMVILAVVAVVFLKVRKQRSGYQGSSNSDWESALTAVQ